MAHRFVMFAAASLAALAAGLAAPRATAEDSAISSIIGEGMHAFHGGCLEEAAKLLTDAIDAGSQDPRAFYFRGLASKRLGDEHAADMDFMEGARLEATGGGHAVGKALERIQGSDRLCLEQYRRKARLLFAHDAPADSSPAAAADGEALRRRRPEMEDLPKPRPARDEAVEEAPAQPEPETPAEPAEPDANEPAPAKSPAAANDDPFATPAESPAADTPAAEKPLAEDPFGDEPAAKPKAEAAEPSSVDDFK